MAFQTSMPSSLYNAAQVRELDRRAIEDFGIPGITLMKRAGQALFAEILQRWPEASHLSIFCGAGNNGGDGYIVAALACQKNIAVTLIETRQPQQDNTQSDAGKAREYALQQGVVPVPAENWLVDADFTEGSIIIDALLGTGFKGALRQPFADLIAHINDTQLPVVAADIPSGLSADSGLVLEQAVQADLTLTFIGMKIGLFTGQGRSYSGDIVFADLQVPPQVYDALPLAQLLDYDTLYARFEHDHPRALSNHKGHHGHLVVVGGDQGFAGAALMAAEAAVRLGAGLVSVITRSENSAAYAARLPEVMVCDASNVEQVEALMGKASAVVIGPGLGTKAWGQKLLQRILESELPTLLDADALNLLSSGRFDHKLPLKNGLITPHPGEASRLLNMTTQAVNQDRVQAVEKLQKAVASVALLKGSGTLIRSESELALCPYGNPGMGSGGMGDVLSGIIGSLMAQGVESWEAAKLGACLHAYAADRLAVEEGMRGLLATDLIAEARSLVNGF